MTKPVTGVALMQLYERGKFELDAPLANYAAGVRERAGVTPGSTRAASRSTKRRSGRSPCATSCGTPPGFDGDGAPEAVSAIYRAGRLRADRNNALPEVIAEARDGAAGVSARHAWQYSATPSTCRPTWCRKLSGVPFDEFLELHILKPLGMTSTRYTILPTDPDRPQLAAMYTRNEDGTFTRQSDEEAYTFNSAAWPLQARQLRPRLDASTTT